MTRLPRRWRASPATGRTASSSWDIRWAAASRRRWPPGGPTWSAARCWRTRPGCRPPTPLCGWRRAGSEVDSDDAYLETGQAWLRLPWQDIAAAITVPTLLVTGSETDLVDAATVREVRRVNPAIEVAVVQGVGHCIRREDAAAYHGVVDPWLAARFPG